MSPAPRLLDLPAAKQFSQDPVDRGSLSAATLLSNYGGKILRKNSSEYEEVRSFLLRNGEQALVLSASVTRRALDLMRSLASPWAHVTLYYGAWHASQAVLNMLGAFVAQDGWVDVNNGDPAHFQLKVGRGSPNKERGSHRRYWRAFYDAIASFEPWIITEHRLAAQPPSGDAFWMITERNLVNYRLGEAMRVALSFSKSFDPATFPTCLSGALATQYQASLNLLGFAFWLAGEVSLETSAVKDLAPNLSRLELLKHHVLESDPPTIAEPYFAQVVC